MTNPIFLPKEDPELPEFFKMIFHYVTGKSEEFDVVERGSVVDGMMYLVTKDDIWHAVVVQNIVRIEYDKKYAKLVALKQKRQNENTISNK